MSDQSNSLIKTPRQLITVVTLAFVVPVIVIILLATYVVTSAPGGAGSDAMTEESIAARMQPAGVVAFAGADSARALQGGEAVNVAACTACHGAGIAGAPRTGDAAAWAPRIKKGFDVLVKHAIEGFKTMPAKGGNPNLDPIEVARAVAFMANQSGAKFKEPAAPVSAPKATGPEAAAQPLAKAAPAPAATVPAAKAAPAPAIAAAAPAAKGAAVSASIDGAKVYASGCNACHATGVAAAPKLGDKAAWAPRLALGTDTLTASVIKGKGVMPARGAVPTATDAELRAAVEHMIATVK